MSVRNESGMKHVSNKTEMKEEPSEHVAVMTL